MKIAIIGAGASGLILGIKIKMNNPTYEVIIIEKNAKVGKKLAMTGNGKCNLGNNLPYLTYYRNETLTSLIFQEYDFKRQQLFFNHLGIKTKTINNLAYPFSESAKSLVDMLYEISLNYGVKYNFNEKALDYKCGQTIKVITDLKEYDFDKLIFASGGKSYAKTGSDGSVFNILKKHGYNIIPLLPALCAILTKESTNDICGLRVKGKVSLYLDQKFVYKEQGEILFKNHGLSGIAIFNISSYIARFFQSFNKATIAIDLFPNESFSDLIDEFNQMNRINGVKFLKGYFTNNLVKYILNRLNLFSKQGYFESEHIQKIAHFCKHFEYTFSQLDSFDNAQITVGGIDTNLISECLESRIEKNVYFAGEILDNDGLCGGFNLMWAFGSALYLGDKLCK